MQTQQLVASKSKIPKKIFGYDFDLVSSVVFHTMMQEDAKISCLPAFGMFRMQQDGIFFDMEIFDDEPPLSLEINDIDKEAVQAVLDGRAKFKSYILYRGRDRYIVFTFTDILSPDEDLDKEMDKYLIDQFFETYNIRNKQDFEPYIDRFMSDMDSFAEHTIEIPVDEDTAKKILSHYPDGIIPPDKIDIGIINPRIGRNDPCFCGSGKKYKKCHGK